VGLLVQRETRIPLLVAKVASAVCAIPIEHVVETMRPMAIEDGMGMHRGDPVRIIDAAAMLGEQSAPKRCVIVRVGSGRAGLLVDEVLGVRRVESDEVRGMRGLFAAESIASVAGELRAVLGAWRVMEESRG
jgi:chemotaxis signal transduction protein